MARTYKQISTCSMCKTRFVVENGKIRRSTYCPACVKKYFGKKEEDKEENKVEEKKESKEEEKEESKEKKENYIL
ncbi:hypothetical protein HOD20_05875 [archaeon]|nr:hypothetical protein [Candidatus Woesearchaeota archaeon]MBT3463361.1 hypothetical protein [archaeon]MBT4352032.1 hypothetical protein [archaeon]MBT4648016.1 hypothetical protein [archaeon]MBT7392369.1 hypothetical protein [archaeon]